MADILIRGLEMPKTWRDCLFSNGAAQCKLDKMELCGLCYRQRCPLVPIPPHGDLIDKDEAYERWLKGEEDVLYNAPVIVPGERGKK
ncbi:MAG: hypothetical protein IJV64_03355 [Oscillospiraceae bacterium]|nr:hypothetical protein [Oscillospiraceae bacterium]